MRWTMNGCKGCVLDENSIFFEAEKIKKKCPFKFDIREKKLGQYRFPVVTCRRKRKIKKGKKVKRFERC